MGKEEESEEKEISLIELSYENEEGEITVIKRERKESEKDY